MQMPPELEARAEAALERIDAASARLQAEIWKHATDATLTKAERAHVLQLAERFVGDIEKIAGACERLAIEDRAAALLALGDAIELVARARSFIDPRLDATCFAIRRDALRAVLGDSPP